MAEGAKASPAPTPEPAKAPVTPEPSKEAANGAGSPSLKEIFEAFAKYGDPKSDGKAITLSNSDKWMKQAKVFDKKLTTVDTGICFKKLKKKSIDFKTFNEYLEDLAKTKGMNAADIKAKLVAGGLPHAANATKPAADATVARLTDTSKYTGSHKERFDASGKGKGKEGREYIPPKDGYVAGYKNKDTFDKTH
jgi:hypothetical protein